MVIVARLGDRGAVAGQFGAIYRRIHRPSSRLPRLKWIPPSRAGADAGNGLSSLGSLLGFLGSEDLLLQVALGGPLHTGCVDGYAAEFGDGGVGFGSEFVEVFAADGAGLVGEVVFNFDLGLRKVSVSDVVE